jgi:serine/threonine-protein kinase
MRRGESLGKYKIRRRIASGGFATVYEAWDLVLDIPVALKIPKHEDDNDLVLEEIRHVVDLEHENVLPILNADYVGTTLVVATPLGRESLREQILRGVGTDVAVSYASQLLAGLAHAHDRGLIHRDVKPENLIVFADGRLRLCDFGLATPQHRVSSGTSGTVGYLAPEQAHGRPSTASDVFAAGLVIHELLTGQLPSWPFDRPLVGHETLCDHTPFLVDVLDKALAVDERERYPDAGAFLTAFQASLHSTPHRLQTA